MGCAKEGCAACNSRCMGRGGGSHCTDRDWDIKGLVRAKERWCDNFKTTNGGRKGGEEHAKNGSLSNSVRSKLPP